VILPEHHWALAGNIAAMTPTNPVHPIHPSAHLRIKPLHQLALLLVLGCSLLVPLAAAQPGGSPRNADQWYAQGRAQFQAGNFKAAAQSFAQAVKLNPTASNWRNLADSQVALGQYDEATQAYDQAIAKYKAFGDKGNLQNAAALTAIANPYRQEAELYWLDGAAPNQKLAKHEPNNGLLLGVYVDEKGIQQDGTLRIPLRAHMDFAVYFRYFKLRIPGNLGSNDLFPQRLAAAATRTDSAIHVSLEPAVALSAISEAMLMPFAQAANTAKLPIFLRFASEMNDKKNAWSQDARLYREKFCLVHKVMARIAPNVAMVWMPMPSSLEAMEPYYPGKNCVDWAGLSLYSTPFLNGDTNRPGLRLSPIDVIKPFYQRYAGDHPIQISEYAASSRSLADGDQDFIAFAVAKMQMLYWGAYFKYPRLKNINWLDIDMISGQFVQSGAVERKNDYRLFDIPEKINVMRELGKEPYFITKFTAPPPSLRPQPFPTTVAATGTIRAGFWLKTFEPYPSKIVVTLFEIEAQRLSKGQHVLKWQVFGSNAAVVLTKELKFTVK
jgi:tetratricopeptide (TPR) repeat protein